MAEERDLNRDLNRDPLSDEPGAHPVGTGVGAAGGAVAGASFGAMGGPIGAAVGAVGGAIVGGLAGKATAEAVNPTAETAYWRENYTREPYYETGMAYEEYHPAYELGWNARTKYEGDFDAVDNRLQADWAEMGRESRLSWPNARHAARAAWDRVDSNVGASSQDDLSNDDVIDVLNDLIENSHDGEYGFKACAENTNNPDLKSLFQRRSETCAKAANELRALVVGLGGKPEEGGTASGALHRGWVSVKGTLAGHSDVAMLDECERGEDAALARYRKALKQNLPANVRSVITQQQAGAQRNHDEIKARRDAAKAMKN